MVPLINCLQSLIFPICFGYKVIINLLDDMREYIIDSPVPTFIGVDKSNPNSYNELNLIIDKLKSSNDINSYDNMANIVLVYLEEEECKVLTEHHCNMEPNTIPIKMVEHLITSLDDLLKKHDLSDIRFKMNSFIFDRTNSNNYIWDNFINKNVNYGDIIENSIPKNKLVLGFNKKETKSFKSGTSGNTTVYKFYELSENLIKSEFLFFIMSLFSYYNEEKHYEYDKDTHNVYFKLDEFLEDTKDGESNRFIRAIGDNEGFDLFLQNINYVVDKKYKETLVDLGIIRKNEVIENSSIKVESIISSFEFIEYPVFLQGLNIINNIHAFQATSHRNNNNFLNNNSNNNSNIENNVNLNKGVISPKPSNNAINPNLSVTPGSKSMNNTSNKGGYINNNNYVKEKTYSPKHILKHADTVQFNSIIKQLEKLLDIYSFDIITNTITIGNIPYEKLPYSQSSIFNDKLHLQSLKHTRPLPYNKFTFKHEIINFDYNYIERVNAANCYINYFEIIENIYEKPVREIILAYSDRNKENGNNHNTKTNFKHSNSNTSNQIKKSNFINNHNKNYIHNTSVNHEVNNSKNIIDNNNTLKENNLQDLNEESNSSTQTIVKFKSKDKDIQASNKSLIHNKKIIFTTSNRESNNNVNLIPNNNSKSNITSKSKNKSKRSVKKTHIKKASQVSQYSNIMITKKPISKKNTVFSNLNNFLSKTKIELNSPFRVSEQELNSEISRHVGSSSGNNRKLQSKIFELLKNYLKEDTKDVVFNFFGVKNSNTNNQDSYLTKNFNYWDKKFLLSNKKSMHRIGASDNNSDSSKSSISKRKNKKKNYTEEVKYTNNGLNLNVISDVKMIKKEKPSKEEYIEYYDNYINKYIQQSDPVMEYHINYSINIIQTAAFCDSVSCKKPNTIWDVRKEINFDKEVKTICKFCGKSFTPMFVVSEYKNEEDPLSLHRNIYNFVDKNSKLSKNLSLLNRSNDSINNNIVNMGTIKENNNSADFKGNMNNYMTNNAYNRFNSNNFNNNTNSNITNNVISNSNNNISNNKDLTLNNFKQASTINNNYKLNLNNNPFLNINLSKGHRLNKVKYLPIDYICGAVFIDSTEGDLRSENVSVLKRQQQPVFLNVLNLFFENKIRMKIKNDPIAYLHSYHPSFNQSNKHLRLPTAKYEASNTSLNKWNISDNFKQYNMESYIQRIISSKDVENPYLKKCLNNNNATNQNTKVNNYTNNFFLINNNPNNFNNNLSSINNNMISSSSASKMNTINTNYNINGSTISSVNNNYTNNFYIFKNNPTKTLNNILKENTLAISNNNNTNNYNKTKDNKNANTNSISNKNLFTNSNYNKQFISTYSRSISKNKNNNTNTTSLRNTKEQVNSIINKKISPALILKISLNKFTDKKQFKEFTNEVKESMCCHSRDKIIKYLGKAMLIDNESIDNQETNETISTMQNRKSILFLNKEKDDYLANIENKDYISINNNNSGINFRKNGLKSSMKYKPTLKLANTKSSYFNNFSNSINNFYEGLGKNSNFNKLLASNNTNSIQFIKEEELTPKTTSHQNTSQRKNSSVVFTTRNTNNMNNHSNINNSAKKSLYSKRNKYNSSINTKPHNKFTRGKSSSQSGISLYSPSKSFLRVSKKNTEVKFSKKQSEISSNFRSRKSSFNNNFSLKKRTKSSNFFNSKYTNTRYSNFGLSRKNSNNTNKKSFLLNKQSKSGKSLEINNSPSKLNDFNHDNLLEIAENNDDKNINDLNKQQLKYINKAIINKYRNFDLIAINAEDEELNQVPYEYITEINERYKAANNINSKKKINKLNPEEYYTDNEINSLIFNGNTKYKEEIGLPLFKKYINTKNTSNYNYSNHGNNNYNYTDNEVINWKKSLEDYLIDIQHKGYKNAMYRYKQESRNMKKDNNNKSSKDNQTKDIKNNTLINNKLNTSIATKNSSIISPKYYNDPLYLFRQSNADNNVKRENNSEEEQALTHKLKQLNRNRSHRELENGIYFENSFEKRVYDDMLIRKEHLKLNQAYKQSSKIQSIEQQNRVDQILSREMKSPFQEKLNSIIYSKNGIQRKEITSNILQSSLILSNNQQNKNTINTRTSKSVLSNSYYNPNYIIENKNNNQFDFNRTESNNGIRVTSSNTGLNQSNNSVSKTHSKKNLSLVNHLDSNYFSRENKSINLLKRGSTMNNVSNKNSVKEYINKASINKSNYSNSAYFGNNEERKRNKNSTNNLLNGSNNSNEFQGLSDYQEEYRDYIKESNDDNQTNNDTHSQSHNNFFNFKNSTEINDSIKERSSLVSKNNVSGNVINAINNIITNVKNSSLSKSKVKVNKSFLKHQTYNPSTYKKLNNEINLNNKKIFY